MFLPQSSAGQDLLLRHRRVVLDVTFTGASPSTSVRHASDVPGGVYLASQSLDDTAAQDSDCNFGSLQNNNSGASTVGVLIQAPQTLGGIVDKLYSVSVAEVTSTAGTVTSALKGDSSTGLTASGNIAFTISGSTANLDSDLVTYRVTLECKIDQRQD